MKIVHRSEDLLQDKSPAKPVKPKGKSAREIRVGLWMARQYEKDYQDALKKYADRIAEIQKHEPGWMPAKE